MMSPGRAERRNAWRTSPYRRALRSQESPELPRASWISLPAEIREIIFEKIARQNHPRWASRCAAVSKHWQAIVEPRNFYRLKLTGTCLEEFATIFARQDLHNHVKRICLNVDLPQYTCDTCSMPATDIDEARHNHKMRTAIQQLFSVLSSWKPAGDLVLELNAFSQSDTQHYFKHHRRGRWPKDHGDNSTWSDPKDNSDHFNPNDRHQFPPPSTSATAKIHSILCRDPPQDLPTVRAVRGLVIPREVRRQFFPPVLETILKSLPELQTVCYEPWRIWQCRRLREGFVRLPKIFENTLPTSVKSLTIYETPIIKPIFTSFTQQALAFADPHEDIVESMTGALLKKSFALEHLSISFFICADMFLRRRLPEHSWHHLRTLTLTSKTLTSSAEAKDFSTLLYDASLAALQMPQLERMVLWNCAPGEACAFFYERNMDRYMPTATLTLRATWDAELSRDVVESWKMAATGCYKIRTVKEKIEMPMRSHADAIFYLRLPEGVVDPISFWQLRMEGLVDCELLVL